MVEESFKGKTFAGLAAISLGIGAFQVGKNPRDQPSKATVCYESTSLKGCAVRYKE